MEATFEYCALRYLLQWERSERELFGYFRKRPTTDQLCKALRFFRVARNFKGLRNEKKALSIVSSLAAVRKKTGVSSAAKVQELARAFKRDFKKTNVSASSKLLWLCSRKPFILYDSRAIETLRKKYKRKIASNDYEDYCAQWKKQYKVSSKEIDAAVARIRKVRPFLKAWHSSEDELAHLASRRWFKERVFDLHLWESVDDLEEVHTS